MDNNAKIEKFKTYCVRCNCNTNHVVIRKYSQEYTPDNTPEMQIDYAKGIWQIIQCMGCESVSFREYWLTDEDYFPGIVPKGTEHLYPNVGPDDLYEERFVSLPPKIFKLYQEIIKSYNHGLVMACTGLIRSIIEGIANECAELFNLPDIMAKQQGKGGIEGKVSKLIGHGILSENHGHILQESRILGNYAIHELKTPPVKELRELIKIVEHSLYEVFEINKKLEELKSNRVHRAELKKSKSSESDKDYNT